MQDEGGSQDGVLPQQVLHLRVQAVPGFAGRTNELTALEQALWAASSVPAARVVAIHGVGGVGKSTLAAEYAWRNRARYRGVWWLRARRRETLANDLGELGARSVAGLDEVAERDKVVRLALDWVEKDGTGEKPWLIVYDDAGEPGHIDGVTPRTGAHVLVTSRRSGWSTAAAEVAIPVLPADAAVQYLLEATNRSDRTGAESLAAALGHLPLALCHAAHYCRSTGMDFAAYRKLAGTLPDRAVDSETEPEGVEHDPAVITTVALAIARAAKLCPASEKLMGLAAFWAPDQIPLSLFPADILTDSERTEAVAALAGLALIALDPLDGGSPGIAMQRLVQGAMRRRLTGMGEYANAAMLAAELVADAFPAGDPGSDDARTWPTCARLMPHAMAVLDHAPDTGAGIARTAHLLSQAVLYLRSRAATAEAVPLARRAEAILEQFERETGGRHPDHALVRSRLAATQASLCGNGASQPEPTEAIPGSADAEVTPETDAGAIADAAPPIVTNGREPSDLGASAAPDLAPDLAPVAATPAPPPAGKATFLNWMFGRQ
ncbi:MAG TPA: AAA family ATPase [Hyphomicrobiaceae bacterium]|nr:AAA family ATPase [Hyphomicrobiaceae bacterium]